MQGIRRALIIDAEPLITKSGWNAIGPQKSRQKMAFRIAITGAGGENLRSGAGNRIAFVVGTV
jgi:hypothetical protein